jgi:purine-binding chemotaxis protein CheW
MAEQQFVLFKLADGEYGIEVNDVQEIVRFQEITKIPEAQEFIKGILNLRGQVIPVIDLKRRFYLEDSKVTDSTRIVVVKVEERKIGIIADEVSEVLRIADDNIEPTPAFINNFNQSGIKGVAKVEERLLILLDLAKTLSFEEIQEIKKVI